MLKFRDDFVKQYHRRSISIETVLIAVLLKKIPKIKTWGFLLSIARHLVLQSA